VRVATTRSTNFDVRGYNRITLVCSDMKETVDFYQGVLGFPLVKTIEYSDGSQQFFFQVTEADYLAFVWSPNAPPPAPGIAGAGWGRTDEFGNRLPGFGMLSAPGSMHHLAFDISIEKIEEYRQRLRSVGVETTSVWQHIFYGEDGQQVLRREDLPPGAKYVDEFINSVYFGAPDGVVLEFAAYTRPLGPGDVKHTPAKAEEAAARLARAKERRAALRAVRAAASPTPAAVR
jgi:catechol 2,3-dioxygenase-like lactoylglutathione lyase family enzyme